MKIHAGTSGYGYKEWKGLFYPEKISPGEMLRYYSDRLGTVEINNTFYRMPTEDLIVSWGDQVPDDFIFAFKAPRTITHLKRLRDAAQQTNHLFKTLSVLGARLGPVLFQFPPGFQADPAALKDFLEILPRRIPCAFEFRNRSWFDDEILDLLRAKGCSLCVADSEDNRVEKIFSTASWGYLRLRRPDYGDADLLQWLRSVRSQDWERAFVFFKHEEGTKGPAMAIRFNELVHDEEKTPQPRPLHTSGDD
jgi:uncharacterized protein YecE (DUF72 family)